MRARAEPDSKPGIYATLSSKPTKGRSGRERVEPRGKSRRQDPGTSGKARVDLSFGSAALNTPGLSPSAPPRVDTMPERGNKK